MTPFKFRVLRFGDSLHLFGVNVDHLTPCMEINKYCGSEVVKLWGSGIGVNLKIIDDDSWSDKISMHVIDPVDGTEGVFTLNLPIGG